MDWDRIEGNWKLHAAPWVKGGIGVTLSELTALGSESRPRAHEIPRKPPQLLLDPLRANWSR